MDREKVIKEYENYVNSYISFTTSHDYEFEMHKAVLALLKEQEAEMRQLRLALDIAKGTCKGIKSGGGQFADMPTMQSAT